MPEDVSRDELGRQLADRFFFSPLIPSVPHIPLTCDLAQAPKQTWSVHGYTDTSILNNPKAVPNWCCTVLEVGEAVHGCAKLWAIRQFILLSRSVTCPGCGILAPFKMCQLKQSLQNTSLSSHPVFLSVLEELLCSTPQSALRLLYKWKLLKGFVATSLSLLSQMTGVGAFLEPIEILWDGGRQVTVWAASSRGKWYTHTSQCASCCRCAEQTAKMSGLVFAEPKFLPLRPVLFPLPRQMPDLIPLVLCRIDLTFDFPQTKKGGVSHPTLSYTPHPLQWDFT